MFISINSLLFSSINCHSLPSTALERCEKQKPQHAVIISKKQRRFFHRKIRTGKQVPGVAKLSIINLEFSLSQNKVATKILLAYNRVLGKNLGRTLEENASFEKQIGTVSNA